MGRTTKSLTSQSSIDHLAVDSSTHKRDIIKAKATNEALLASGGRMYYRLPQQRRIIRIFPGAPQGLNIVRGLGIVNPLKWREAIQSAERKRQYYRAPMWDKKRKAFREVRRKIKRPIGTHLQSCPPYLSDALETLCKTNRLILAKNLLLSWSEQNALEFERLTRCEVLARAIHWDTDDPHTDIVFSRYTPAGIILKHGLGVCGPWMTATDRLLRMGCKESQLKSEYDKSLDDYSNRQRQTKKQQLNSKIELPTDIQIARCVDAWVDRQLLEMGFDVDALKDIYINRYRNSRINLAKQELEALKVKISLIEKELFESDIDCEKEKNHKINPSPDPTR